MYLRLYCPICKRVVEAVPADGYYVCRNCGYVFTDYPEIEASEYMFTKDGDSIRTHIPIVNKTADRVYKQTHVLFSHNKAKELEKIMNCIHRTLGEKKIGRRKMNKKWLIEAILTLIEQSPDKTLSRSELLNKYANSPTRKKIAITALTLICNKCVKCTS